MVVEWVVVLLLAPIALLGITLSFAILLRAWNEAIFSLFGNSNVHLRCSDDVKANAVNRSVMVLIENQLMRGLQRDIQVTAYHNGRRVVNVWGGSAAVKETSLFMPFSVCKGVAATAVALCVERAELDYEERVSTYWPAFAQGGKGEVTVEQALSHRAGIYPNSIAPLFKCWFSDWIDKWAAGIGWVERCCPAADAVHAEEAEYHMVSFSWIVGGIVQFATGHHITEAVADLASRLGMMGEMYMGVLSGVSFHRVRPMSSPLQYVSGPTGEAAIPLWRWPIVYIEALLVPLIASSRWWSRMCIPSSNGFWSARAVAKMYGALANEGRADGKTIISEATVRTIASKMRASANSVPTRGYDKPAMLALGFSPWLNSHATGDSSCVLAHGGMGGCYAFGDLDHGIAVCVLKNSFSPVTLIGTGACPTVNEIARHIHNQLVHSSDASGGNNFRQRARSSSRKRRR
jgi:CubicO group peptidase (beta-lactamase class C family)